MASRGHRRPSPAHGPLALLGLLAPFAGLLVVAALWLSLAAPFASDGDDARERPRGAVALRAESAREDGRAWLAISGRAPSAPARSSFVVRVLGRTDVAGPCPVPVVRRSGVVVPPAGSTRVGWDRIAGRVPGTPMRAGAAFRLTGTVAARGSGALRLCVHLVRTGRAAGVVRTIRVVVPSRAGMTPLSVPLRSAYDGVLPVLRIVGLVVALLLSLWLVLRVRRRVRLARPAPVRRADGRGRSGRGPLRGERRGGRGQVGAVRRAGAAAEPQWSRALDLPPLPDGVSVPDAPPWLPGADDDASEPPVSGPSGDAGHAASGLDPFPGPPVRGPRGPDRPTSTGVVSPPTGQRSPATTVPTDPATTVPATEPAPGERLGPAIARAAPGERLDPAIAGAGASADPQLRATGTAGASARATGMRREARWRERRRVEAETAGEVWDPTERAPFHVRAWALGAEGEELAAERFAALARGYPGIHVLHDRREPGRGPANIDHVLVGPAGVVVADTKHWAGVVRIEAGRLHVRGKDRTSAIDGVCGQVSSVRAVLAAAGLGAVPVLGVLHWTRSDRIQLDGSIELAGVPLLDARGTMMRAIDGGVLARDGVAQVVAVLEAGLRAAG